MRPRGRHALLGRRHIAIEPLETVRRPRPRRCIEPRPPKSPRAAWSIRISRSGARPSGPAAIRAVRRTESSMRSAAPRCRRRSNPLQYSRACSAAGVLRRSVLRRNSGRSRMIDGFTNSPSRSARRRASRPYRPVLHPPLRERSPRCHSAIICRRTELSSPSITDRNRLFVNRLQVDIRCYVNILLSSIVSEDCPIVIKKSAMLVAAASARDARISGFCRY